MNKILLICSTLTMFIAFSSPVYAYLDPGTGSIIFQGLVAAIATGLATARFWWHRITGIFFPNKDIEVGEQYNETES